MGMSRVPNSYLWNVSKRLVSKRTCSSADLAGTVKMSSPLRSESDILFRSRFVRASALSAGLSSDSLVMSSADRCAHIERCIELIEQAKPGKGKINAPKHVLRC